MAFALTRPSSPSREMHPGPSIITAQEDDHLSSAVHAAFAGFSSVDNEMSKDKDKDKPHLEILVSSDCLSLKGTGVDVEPALLQGHVALYLTESTSIKEITLQFRGKARLPVPMGEPLSLNNSPLTYVVCNHDWSFLEGEKRHSHTLKAGRHLFPFQLQLGGSLPSSISTAIYGGASVIYKLRAVAVRPGFASNLQTALPISIIRSFAPEALEYQQTLEIENTWPEKIMYSIMIPHKAWAIGDQITGIVKFSPLTKGVRVLTIQTMINEITKLYSGRTGSQEHTRTVATAKHEIVDGKAVSVAEHFHRPRNQALNISGSHGSHSVPVTASHTPALSAEHRTSSSGSLSLFVGQDLSLTTYPSATPSTSSSNDGHVIMSRGPSVSQAPHPPVNDEDPDEDETMSSSDVVTQISLTVPSSATPTHALEPITVNHRIRWSILISNLDGHTSELRCSLPLHILDHRLIEEARANTAATRRLVLGSSEVQAEEEQDMELPSYPAHVRDRVANMYLPEAATVRVTNPWVYNNISPTFMADNQTIAGFWTPSGASSPLPDHPASLPHAPTSGASTPLDWVNSELLLSLSNEEPPRPTRASPMSSEPDSQTPSRPDSRRASRRPSRASSPERHTSLSTIPTPTGSSHDTYVHGGSHASRNLHGLFSASMKPFTSLTSSGWLSSRSSSHSNLSSLASLSSTDTHRPQTTRPPPTPPADSNSESALWHRAFTEVPDYGIASRGFIGGVPPLSSMRGLPSYEEAERSSSETDLAGRFAHAHRHHSSHHNNTSSVSSS